MKKNKFLRILGVAGLAAAALAVASAQAATGQITTCTVQYTAMVNERLIVKCTQDPNEFSVVGSGWTACNSRFNSDTFKTINSMAQSALLSGKPLLFNWTDDGTCPVTTKVINYMRISAQ